MKVTKWHIYEFLKGNNTLRITAKDIEMASAKEIKEGLIEFLILKQKK